MLRAFARRFPIDTRIKLVGVYGALNALPSIATAAVSLFYAIKMSLTVFGVYSVILSAVTVINIIIDFGLPNAVARHYFDRHDDPAEARRYASSMFYGARILSVAGLIFCGGILFVMKDIAGFKGYLIPIVLLIAFLDRSLEMFGALFRTMELPYHFASGRLAMVFGQVCGALLLVGVLDLKFAGAILALIVGRTLGVIAYALCAARIGILKAAIDWSDLREGLRFGLPLLPSRLAVWGRQVGVRPLLSVLVPYSMVGVFMVATAVAAVPQLLSTAIDLALGPIYFRRRATGDSGFALAIADFAKVLVTILFPVWVVLILVCPHVMGLFVRVHVREASAVCAVMLVGTFARLLQPFLIRQLSYLKATGAIPFIAIPGALLSLGIALFASRYGIIAAAFGSAVSETAVAIGFVIALRRYEPPDLPVRLAMLLLAILALVAFWVAYGKPLPNRISELAFDIPLIVGSVCFAWFSGIWPHRTLLRRLVAG